MNIFKVSKASKSLMASTIIALLASTAFSFSPILAVEYIIDDTTNVQNGGNTLNAGDSLTILSTGVININTFTVDAVSATGGSTIINNYGAINTLSGSSIGIFASSTLNTINNYGIIDTVSNDGNAIETTGITNTILNAGTIITRGNRARGIKAVDSNVITNTGTITTQGIFAYGIEIGSGNIITNMGTITTQGALAYGINAAGESGNIISNMGTITTQGGTSIGIQVGSSNTITNTGTITTQGDRAHGIEAFNGNTITNEGIIITQGANSEGIVAINELNTINNSGYVVSTQSNSFLFSSYPGHTNTLNLTAPSFIGGTIDLGVGTTLNITTGRSQSNLWQFDPTDLVGGEPIINGNVPWAYNVATGTFATIDPTALSAAPNMVADMAGSLSDVARNNGGDNNWWLSGFGSWSGYGANGIYNDYYNYGGGIVGGISSQVSDGFNIGAMAGYGVNYLTVNSKWEVSQTIEAKGVVGGVYGNVELDNFFANFAVFGGAMGNDSSRFVNDNLATNSAGETWGIDYAEATYNSWFISPELRIGADIDIGSDWTITPSAMIRYTNQATDGYIETGSNANATMAARTVQMIEGNVELAASTTLEGNGKLTLAGGVDYRQALSGNQAVTLIGENITIAQNTASTIIGYVSANASYELGGASLDLSAKAAFGTNGYESVAGSVGISGKF